MDHMLKQLTSMELTELEAMWVLEGGWGSHKEDWRAAKSDMIQVNINKGKDSQPAKVTDMIMNPDIQRQVRESKGEQMSKVQKVREGFKKLARTDPANKGKKKKTKKGRGKA